MKNCAIILVLLVDLQYIIHGTIFSTPDTTNATGSYFFFDFSNQLNFQDTVVCPTSSNCYVKCNGRSSCSSGTLNSTMANYFEMDCNGENACVGVDIYCPDYYSPENKCQINCGNYNGSCTGFNILRIPNDFVFDSVIINCPNYPFIDSCNIGRFFCVDPSTSSRETRLDWDSTTQKYECNDYDCCPMSSKYISGPTCSTSQCVIDCMNGLCSNKLIDARAAFIDEITINCNDDYSCLKTIILCPNSDTSLCTVNCLGEYGCSHTEIRYGGVGTVSQEVTLNCLETDNSCFRTTIYGRYIGNMNYKCIDATVCSEVYMYIDSVINVNMTCFGESYGPFNLYHKGCSATRVFATNLMNEFNIKCYGARGCQSGYYLLQNANKVNIIALQEGGSYLERFHVENIITALNAICVGNFDDGNYNGCYEITFYLTNELSKVNIKCYEKGCDTIRLWSSYNDMNIFGNVDASNMIAINKCNKCDILSECVSDIDLQCGPTDNTSNAIFNGIDCDSNYCGCSSFKNNIISNTINDVDDIYCTVPAVIPTMTPDTAPALTKKPAIPTSPTAPTSSPTSPVESNCPSITLDLVAMLSILSIICQ